MTDDLLEWLDCPCSSEVCLPRAAKARIEAQAVEIEWLRGALQGVMPYVLSEYLECHGDKCRHLTCASCFGEDAAGEHNDKATEAERVALAVLAGKAEQ
jgi:hypothetical protein